MSDESAAVSLFDLGTLPLQLILRKLFIEDIANLAESCKAGHDLVKNVPWSKHRETREETLKSEHDLAAMLHWCALGIVFKTSDLSVLDDFEPEKKARLRIAYDGNSTDLSNLRGVRQVKIESVNRVTDVTPLEDAEEVEIWKCGDLEDVSPLKKVRALDIYQCGKIKDVSALGSIPKLGLIDCTNIADVSALGGVKDLTIVNCSKVEDVSALGSVRTLNLAMLDNLNDVSALTKCRIVNLTSCNRVTDISMLGNGTTLIVIQCSGISDEMAKSVGALNLDDIGNLQREQRGR